MLNLLRQAVPLCRHLLPVAQKTIPKPSQLPNLTDIAKGLLPTLSCTRPCSSYDAYPEYDTPSPYKKPLRINYDFQYKYYSGGVLPRPKGGYEDKPLKGLPEYKPKGQWTTKKALFGQNDYIDILGDGSVHPYQLMDGPKWLEAFRGNELQRLIRRTRYEGRMLREMYPSEYHNMRKRIFFLLKRMNRRRPTPYWGAKSSARRSRIDYIRGH